MSTAHRLPRLLLAAALAALPARAAAQAALRGTVVDGETGAPVAGAVVRLTSRADSALTSSDGRWSLASVDGTARIEVRRMGYATRRVVAGPGEMRIALAPGAVGLDAVVVTASRRLQRLGDAPAATEIVTRREIEDTGASDLASVLTEQTGVQLHGGHPAGAGAMIEGMGSERILILLDGQPLAGRISGELDLSRIPAWMAQRVEVVKGPQSTLYGSEAMGGVINVITRPLPSRGWQGGVQLTAGTQGRMDGAATLATRAGRLGLGADVTRRSVELTAGQGGSTGALSEDLDGLLKASWDASAALRLDAGGALWNQEQRWGAGQLFQFARNQQREARAGAAWTAGHHRITPLVHLSEFEHRSRAATVTNPGDDGWTRETQGLLDAEVLYAGTFGRHAVDAGIEGRRERIVSDRVEGEKRTLHSVEPYAQLTLSGARWSVVPGVRMAWSEQWGTHWTPRVAAVFRPLPALALRASVGRGYRAPSFKELYLDWVNESAGYAVHGNPDLTPETSTNLTAGFEWAPGDVYLRAQAYNNRFSDFIDTRETAAGTAQYTYLNVQDGRTRGIEAEAGIQRGPARAEVGYGYLDAVDLSTGLRLPERPAHSGRLALGYAATSWLRGTLTGVYTGAVDAQPETGTAARGAFLRWDLHLTQSLPRGAELTLGADNLFAQHADNWPGFTGRRLYLGLGWRGSFAPVSAATNDGRPAASMNTGDQ